MNRSERLEWMGGGYDAPGIHSICPHPVHADEMLLGISCGGAWRTTDGAANWDLRAAGMNADFMPPERQGDQNIQDPHLIARCAGAPDVLWTQHHCGIWRSTDNGVSWAGMQGRPGQFRALRSQRIRAMETRPGLCPPSKMNAACPSTAPCA